MLGTMLRNFRKIKLRSDQPELVSLADESMQMMREYAPVRLYSRTGGLGDQPSYEFMSPYGGQPMEKDHPQMDDAEAEEENEDEEV
ncbi:hypothetical protein MLD38_006374 [Melastoma candidum]|uniref:Uncharacterized protein n=1 Tax=Melastoma candidum TaxID=119954 RepID=A0ACB9RW49_9MYRT|nr:hypothetical protein MLD38_006374 [Melastoma candidum]